MGKKYGPLGVFGAVVIIILWTAEEGSPDVHMTLPLDQNYTVVDITTEVRDLNLASFLLTDMKCYHNAKLHASLLYFCCSESPCVLG